MKSLVKKNKLFYGCVLLIFIFSVALSSCANNPEDQKIFSTINDHEITLMKQEKDISFSTLIGNQNLEDIPYVKIGTALTINFSESIPKTIQIEDMILNDDGTLKYAQSETLNVPFTINGNTVTFYLGVNSAAYLSSDSKDYLPGNCLRGIKLYCTWNDEMNEYLFILRTDAG